DAQLPESGASIPDYAYLQRGAEGRAVLAGTGDQLSTEPGVVSMRIGRMDGRLTVGANAFFFQEGTADIYAQARGGGFGVADDGTALLAGLYDGQLQLLGSNRR